MISWKKAVYLVFELGGYAIEGVSAEKIRYREPCSISTGKAIYWFLWVLPSSDQISFLSTEN